MRRWSLGSTVLALLALLVSMPLWLIPPLVLILPPLIWGWLTYRVMTFDALAEHASREERARCCARHRLPLLGIGVLAGYLGAAPRIVWASGALFAAAFPVLVAAGDLDLHAGVRFLGAVVRPLLPGGAGRPLRAAARGAPRLRPSPAVDRRCRCQRGRAMPRIGVPHDACPNSMDFGLIIVGDEILSGKRGDKHMPKVIELLAARGLATRLGRYVGDEPRASPPTLGAPSPRRHRVLAAAASAPRPTTTRASAPAAALGVPLALHPRPRR